MASARPGVPRDYNQLFRNFGPFIADEIRKRNTVEGNFQDAFQDVCEKLLKAQVIEKFHARFEDDVPETMTTLEVCAFLGVSLRSWQQRGQGYYVGFTQKNAPRYFSKKWVPLPVEAPRGTSRRPWACGLWSNSPKAVFKTDDVLQLDEMPMRWRNQGVRTAPTSKREPTAYQFLNYLGTAIRNHFANFCRTRSRKWQDRPGDAMPGNSKRLLGESVPQFRTADGGYNSHWEDTIRDDVADSRIEAQVALSRTLDRLESRGVGAEVQEELLELVAGGYTLVEAIKKSSLPLARKRQVAAVFAALA